MRTLASTFEAREDAEAASRRLQSIGIPRDLIVTKYVAPGGGESGFFVSAKVNADQIDAATEILRKPAPPPEPPAEARPASAPTPVAERPAAPAPAASEAPHRPLPSARPDFAGATAVPSPAAPETAARPRRPEEVRAKTGRTLVLFGLALVAAFMVGAWLGLLA